MNSVHSHIFSQYCPAEIRVAVRRTGPSEAYINLGGLFFPIRLWWTKIGCGGILWLITNTLKFVIGVNTNTTRPETRRGLNSTTTCYRVRIGSC